MVGQAQCGLVPELPPGWHPLAVPLGMIDMHETVVKLVPCTRRTNWHRLVRLICGRERIISLPYAWDGMASSTKFHRRQFQGEVGTKGHYQVCYSTVTQACLDGVAVLEWQDGMF